MKQWPYSIRFSELCEVRSSVRSSGTIRMKFYVNLFALLQAMLDVYYRSVCSPLQS